MELFRFSHCLNKRVKQAYKLRRNRIKPVLKYNNRTCEFSLRSNTIAPGYNSRDFEIIIHDYTSEKLSIRPPKQPSLLINVEHKEIFEGRLNG